MVERGSGFDSQHLQKWDDKGGGGEREEKEEGEDDETVRKFNGYVSFSSLCQNA
jgi:hypothetical protein